MMLSSMARHNTRLGLPDGNVKRNSTFLDHKESVCSVVEVKQLASFKRQLQGSSGYRFTTWSSGQALKVNARYPLLWKCALRGLYVMHPLGWTGCHTGERRLQDCRKILFYAQQSWSVDTLEQTRQWQNPTF